MSKQATTQVKSESILIARMPIERETTLQRAAISAAPAHSVPPIVHDVLSSPGQSLNTDTRAFMESRFGHDFSGVRIHIDGRSAESARSVDALAYTVGRNIVFGAGQYSPGTIAGKRLLAHELTHVVQQHQNADMTPQGKLRVNEAQDAAEQEAESIAKRVNTGERAVINQRGGMRLQCQPAAPVTSTATPAKSATPIPKWSDAQLKTIQRRLAWLGLYLGTADANFGPGTESALIEAFGGDEWRTLTPDVIIARLNMAQRPKGKRGEHELQYGEMFKDGILDMTLGIGFDEYEYQPGQIPNQEFNGMKAELLNHDFKEDPATAATLYKKAGRVLGPSAFGMYFVLQHPLQYKPPASAARQVQVVVRLIGNVDQTHGKEAAGAFKEGMKQSDIAYYSGHGRYGSGPDFDRNMTFELLKADGTLEERIVSYEVLQDKLKQESPTHDAWTQFLWRDAHKRIKVIGFNAGNIYLNPNRVEPEFGAKLMYWNLNRSGGLGAPLVTGAKRELAQAATPSEHKFRLLVFDGCRTQDYVSSLSKKTPGYDTKSTDMIVTQRTVYGDDDVRTMVAFLNAVLKQQSAEQIVRDMDAQNVTNRPKGDAGIAIKQEGFQDNPVVQ